MHTNDFDRVLRGISSQRLQLSIISAFANILLLVPSIYMLQIYDRVLASGSRDTLFWMSIIACFVLFGYGILEVVRRLILSRIVTYIEGELSSPTLSASMSAKMRGERPKAEIRDIADFKNYFQGDTVLAFYDAPWCPIFIFLIWLLHPALGAIALVGACLLVLATFTVDKLTRKQQSQITDRMRKNQEQAVNLVESSETIIPLGMREGMLKNWNDEHRSVQNIREKISEKTITLLGVTRTLRLILQIAILGVGAFWVLEGELTAGGMIAASIIGGRALAPLDRVNAAWKIRLAKVQAQNRLKSLYSSVLTDEQHVILDAPVGKISAESVRFHVPSRREAILANINFSIDEPGTVCAILGPSGAGKTALCRLLVGASQPTSGHVRLDGADVANWPDKELGEHIGYLPQTVQLFEGTIGQNIARFQDIDESKLFKATRMAGVHELILSLPNGYDTVIRSHLDQNLSVGQMQRVAFARALYGDPVVVVLDEPNSNLDSQGDQALKNAMQELKAQGSTVMIVTHRAEALNLVDKIMLMKDGQISRFGNRTDFLTAVQKVQKAKPKSTEIRDTQTVGQN